MTDFQINDYLLDKECEGLAREIFEQATEDMADDETPEDHSDTMADLAHEFADGHEWVIYTYKAHHVCLFCNVDQGEEFLEDVGLPETPTYDSLATMIVFGEMRARIQASLEDMIDEWEEPDTV